jgi:hypothetical protein
MTPRTPGPPGSPGAPGEPADRHRPNRARTPHHPSAWEAEHAPGPASRSGADREDEGAALRDALARTAQAYMPPAAPLGRIVAAGRARRTRRRASAVAAVAAVVVLGVTVPLARWGGGPRTDEPAAPAMLATGDVTPGVTVRPPSTAVTGHGMVDGTPWSVTVEFYPDAPAGALGPHALPDAPLLCTRIVIGGVRVDHQGGPWTDCDRVDGTDDPKASGDLGLWGLHDKGTSGSRLMVAHPGPQVAYAIVRLTDGTPLTGHVVTVPHTSYRSWAVGIPDGRTIAAVDTYDAHHHLLDHDTVWR